MMLHAKTRIAVKELKELGKTKVIAEEIAWYIEQKYNIKLEKNDINSISLYLSANYPKERVYLITYSPNGGKGLKKSYRRVNMYDIGW